MTKCPKVARFFLKSLPLKEAAIRRTKTNGACLTWPISFITCTTGLECTHQVQCLLLPSTLQPKNNTTCSGYWTRDWLLLWKNTTTFGLGIQVAALLCDEFQDWNPPAVCCLTVNAVLGSSAPVFISSGATAPLHEEKDQIYINTTGRRNSKWKHLKANFALETLGDLLWRLCSARISTSQKACACPETSCEDDM